MAATQDTIFPDPELLLENYSELKEFDDADETLSLSNLALDESFCDGNGSSKDDEEFFEFFTYGSTHHKDGVFFCGKLIPFKGKECSDSFTRNSSITPQTSDSSTKFGTVPSKVQQRQVLKASQTMPVHATGKFASDVSIKPSKNNELIRATPTKSRWYVLTFGSSGRLPAEMGLNDLKTRQKKRNMRAKISQNGRESVTSYSERQGKMLWSLLKAMSCRNYHATAVAKASFRCTPRMLKRITEYENSIHKGNMRHHYMLDSFSSSSGIPEKSLILEN